MYVPDMFAFHTELFMYVYTMEVYRVSFIVITHAEGSISKASNFTTRLGKYFDTYF